MKKVAQIQQLHASSISQPAKAVAIIPYIMMIDIIMRRPQRVEGGDSHQQASARAQQSAGMLERNFGFRKMFKHVQHQDQIKCLTGLEACIELLQKDSWTVWAVRSDCVFVRFHTEDFAEAAKTIKQQPIAAAHIKNPQGAV